MFLRILSKHAPLKSILLRKNHASYIFKLLRKAIIKGSYLENLYFKKRTEHSLRNYKKIKKLLQQTLQKREKNFFNKLNTSFIRIKLNSLNFFKETISTLDVNQNCYIINPDSINISDPIEKIMSQLLVKESTTSRGGSRTTATSKMERFVLLCAQSAPSWQS